MKRKSSPRKLIVEGYSDKRFFQGLQRHFDLEDRFDIHFPGELGSNKGKSGALKQFELWLKEAAEPERYQAVGVVVDADQTPEQGFEKTDQGIKQILQQTGFRLVDAEQRLYQHQASKCVVSYWIAPNHQHSGYLESLILDALQSAEKSYLTEYVDTYLSGIKNPRFDDYNVDRAKLYTYLAIQRKPDKSLPTLMDDGLVDLQQLGQIQSWLERLFKRVE